MAFRTCIRQFEYKVMPFALSKEPGAFQAVMINMLLPLISEGVIIYLNDVLVYIRDVDLRAKLLDQVLTLIWNNKMYFKISKCQFR